jgi:hypothetical protein
MEVEPPRVQGSGEPEPREAASPEVTTKVSIISNGAKEIADAPLKETIEVGQEDVADKRHIATKAIGPASIPHSEPELNASRQNSADSKENPQETGGICSSLKRKRTSRLLQVCSRCERQKASSACIKKACRSCCRHRVCQAHAR